MNYYERVQRAIDFIEENLNEEVSLQDAAREAYMSLASLYRMFFALTGYTVKDYIRHRRMSEASKILTLSDKNIVEIAFEFGFESHEAFSRSFKQITGLSPMALRKLNTKFIFERVNVLDKYLDIQDKELLEKYPEIKVLKDLQPMRVAYYRHISKSPEEDAWRVLLEWFKKAGLDKEGGKARFFGFNNPNPPPDYVFGETEYGYEVWVTIDEDFVIEDETIRDKVFEGGLYAVTSVSPSNGNEIAEAWQRFNKWIGYGKYLPGTHQWLEEHLAFEPDNMKMDLYMPVKQK